MMGEAKPTASLSGLLLARKGAARPAMRRPSMLGNHGNLATSQDDLGWNDMGYDVDPDPSAPMDYEHDSGYNSLAGAVPDVKPEVRQQQERIAEQLHLQAEAGFESVPDMPMPADAVHTEIAQIVPILSVAKPQSVQTRIAPKSKARAANGSKGKAAFTLRLDNDRHLKLRLACAVSNRSAQMLVTDALDAFLDTMPEIGQLASRVAKQ